MITTGAMARDYGVDKLKEFPMLTRVGANFNSLTQFFIDLLHVFRWSKIKMVYDPYGHGTEIYKFCHMGIDSLHQEILKVNNEGKRNLTQGYWKFQKYTEFTDKMNTEIGNYSSK
jgi:hypothetical protein